MSLTFMTATYNEEKNIIGLLNLVAPFVDGIVVCDDGSTDDTLDLVTAWIDGHENIPSRLIAIHHTGLPETVKHRALDSIPGDSWVLMLDGDESLSIKDLQKVRAWVNTNPPQTHVWSNLDEYLDGVPAKSFLKCRVFKKSAVIFSPRIHEDESFSGQGINLGLTVIHSKTASKQIMREKEYLATYKRLLDSGQINTDRYNNLIDNHYFIRSLDE